jgi:hypothetical protein
MKPVSSPNSTLLPPPLVRFFAELANDHAFGDETVGPMVAAAEALSKEADDNHDALMMLQALSLIADQRRPARDRFIDVAEVASMPKGRITVVIRKP